MKRALFAVASVGIVATAVGVKAANAQYAPAPPAYTPPPAYGPSPTYTRSAYRRYPPTRYGGAGYGYGPGPYFVCQAVGARSVGYGRAYFVADAKWQALIRCEQYSGLCIIGYCVPAY